MLVANANTATLVFRFISFPSSGAVSRLPPGIPFRRRARRMERGPSLTGGRMRPSGGGFVSTMITIIGRDMR